MYEWKGLCQKIRSYGTERQEADTEASSAELPVFLVV
jgi:hypothetical protein